MGLDRHSTYRYDAMLGALYARDLRFNPRPQLTCVQVPPPPRSTIIPRRDCLTFRTRKRARAGINFHRDLFSFDIHFHGHHLPRWCESQDRSVQVDVAHHSPPASLFPERFGTLLTMCLPTLIGGSAPATAAVKGA
jgi:hypothetical protein